MDKDEVIEKLQEIESLTFSKAPHAMRQVRAKVSALKSFLKLQPELSEVEKGKLSKPVEALIRMFSRSTVGDKQEYIQHREDKNIVLAALNKSPDNFIKVVIDKQQDDRERLILRKHLGFITMGDENKTEYDMSAPITGVGLMLQDEEGNIIGLDTQHFLDYLTNHFQEILKHNREEV